MKDFRLKDKVFHPQHGNGKIIAVDMESKHPFKVLFGGRFPRIYSGTETDMWDKLYHGHDPEVIVNEKVPDRKKKQYLNIQLDSSCTPPVYVVDAYDSLNDAREAACVCLCVAVGVSVEVGDNV